MWGPRSPCSRTAWWPAAGAGQMAARELCAPHGWCDPHSPTAPPGARCAPLQHLGSSSLTHPGTEQVSQTTKLFCGNPQPNILSRWWSWMDPKFSCPWRNVWQGLTDTCHPCTATARDCCAPHSSLFPPPEVRHSAAAPKSNGEEGESDGN